MPYQYGATVDVLKIVDYPCLANTYAAFFAGCVADEIRVRLGSAAAGRQS